MKNMIVAYGSLERSFIFYNFIDQIKGFWLLYERL